MAIVATNPQPPSVLTLSKGRSAHFGRMCVFTNDRLGDACRKPLWQLVLDVSVHQGSERHRSGMWHLRVEFQQKGRNSLARGSLIRILFDGPDSRASALPGLADRLVVTKFPRIFPLALLFFRKLVSKEESTDALIEGCHRKCSHATGWLIQMPSRGSDGTTILPVWDKEVP